MKQKIKTFFLKHPFTLVWFFFIVLTLCGVFYSNTFYSYWFYNFPYLRDNLSFYYNNGSTIGFIFYFKTYFLLFLSLFFFAWSFDLLLYNYLRYRKKVL